MKFLPVLLVALAAAAAAPSEQSHSLPPLVVVRLDDGRGAAATGGSTALNPGIPAGQAGQTAQTQPLPPMPVTRLEEPGASAILDAGRPLSLRLAAPMPIREVLLLLVRNSGLSLVTGPGVEGTFVGEMHDLTLRQALDLVLRPIGLDYSVQGTAVHVFKRQVETRFIDVNVALAARKADVVTTSDSSGRAKDRSGTRASVAWTVDADPFKGIVDGVAALASPDARFSLDRRSGVLEITDYPERLDRVALYLESIERRLHRQVELQARLVEVTLYDSSATGIKWDEALQRARVGSGAMNFDAFVKALGELGTVRVLASPRVFALHNEPAMMRMANGAGGEFTLAVTPHIAADGTVMLALSRSTSQPTGEMRSVDKGKDKGGVRKTAVLATDDVTTAVRLRDGDTVILPGLLRERAPQPASQSRGLAGLFGGNRSQVQVVKSEAAVLVTSRVVLSGGL